LALAGMAFMIAPATTFAYLGFTDESEIPSWAEEAIGELMDQGVLSGNDDGSFAPSRQLNRAEVAKVIVLASGVELDTYGGPHFPDVATSAWFYDYIETMYNYGWIDGYPDGAFRPGNGINRVELAKMVINAFEIDLDTTGGPHFKDVAASDWFYTYAETAYNNGLMSGYSDGTFGPANPVTRAETARVVYDSQLVVAAPTGPAEGTLEVVISNDTPRGTNVPFNATSVPYTTFEFTASDDSDVEVANLTVTRLGLGDNDDFDSVWMEIDGFKVGNDASINNDDVVQLRFNPPIVVPAGQTLMADIVASSKYGTNDHNIGHHNRLAVVSADDLSSTAANVVGDFPLEGEEMEVADYEVSEVTFSALGSNTNIDVGDNFIEIGKFRMQNSSNTNKDVELRAVTFKNDGTAEIENILENVALYVSGEQVSAETIMDGDYITFRLDNGVTGGYVIEDGDSRIFSMRADIVSAEDGDNINFKVDNYEDIVAIEIGTSFGVKAIGNGDGYSFASATGATSTGVSCTAEAAEDNCARLMAYTIDSGDLNVSRDPASLGNQEYAPGSNDVVFMTARIVVDQPLLLDGVTVELADSSGIVDTTVSGATVTAFTNLNTYFDNFRLFLNDQLVDSENNFTSASTTPSITDAVLAFDTTFEIAGASIMKLVGNITSDAVTGTSIKVSLNSTDFESPEYISTGDQVPTDQMLGSAVASFVEVQVSSISITKSDGLSGGKIVAGVDDVTFMEFVLDNNDSGDVNVTSASIQGVGTGSADTYTEYTAAIFVDGTQQGSSKNLTSAGAATFNDLSVVIPSAGQKEFTVVFNTIEASAGVVSETLATVVANSATATVADATLYEADEDVYLTIKNAASAAATTYTVLESTTTTENLTTATGTTLTFDSAIGTAGTAGATTLTISTAGAVGDKITLTDDAGSTICVLTYVADGVITDPTCDDGVASLQLGATPTAAEQGTYLRAALAGLGYTVTGAGAAAILTETASPFITGNVNSAEVGTVVVGDANGTVGVETDGVTALNLKHTMQIEVTAVDADNVENGQTVYVYNGSALVSATALGGNEFELVNSGSLSVDLGTTIYGDVLVAGTQDVEVMRVRFNAADDEVQIRDLYFTNSVGGTDIGDRVDFKLYNAAGQLVQTKQMTGGDLHFQLGNADRISVPKDESTYVSIKVSVRDITQADQTGKRLTLALDTSEQENGVEAVTAATGSDLATANVTANSVTGQEFVAYRTEMSVGHAATQNFSGTPLAASQEIYRFVVTADSARQIELGKLKFTVNLAGMKASADAVFEVKQVKTDGNIDNTAVVTSAIADTYTAADDITGTVTVTFANQKLSAGDSRTYALLMNNTENTTAGTPAADDDTVSVTISTDNSHAGATTRAAAAGTVVWSDESSTSHSDTSADWLNGYLLNIDTTAKVNSD